jgi:hypothetical protein
MESGLKIGCKSGSDWDDRDVNFFNISVEQMTNFNEFFGEDISYGFNSDVIEFLSHDLSNVIAQQSIDWPTIKSRFVRTVIKDLIGVTKTHKSAVDDLFKSIFQLFEYDSGDRSIRTREILDLDMANSRTQAIPDICIETLELSIKLIVQEDKSYNVGNDRHFMGHHPEAQLMAEAVAAFQENVKIYKRLGKSDIPKAQLIPGIVMLGTCPTFYLINMTQELADSVKRGEEPTYETLVKKYMIPNLPINLSDVMLSKEHMLHIAACYKVFKKFV